MQIGEKNFLSGKEETRRNPDGFQAFLTQPDETFSVKIRAGTYWYSFLGFQQDLHDLRRLLVGVELNPPGAGGKFLLGGLRRPFALPRFTLSGCSAPDFPLLGRLFGGGLRFFAGFFLRRLCVLRFLCFAGLLLVLRLLDRKSTRLNSSH